MERLIRNRSACLISKVWSLELNSYSFVLESVDSQRVEDIPYLFKFEVYDIIYLDFGNSPFFTVLKHVKTVFVIKLSARSETLRDEALLNFDPVKFQSMIILIFKNIFKTVHVLMNLFPRF
jgi:hypothetical protein